MCKTESLYCAAEIDRTIQINYNKEFKKGFLTKATKLRSWLNFYAIVCHGFLIHISHV